MRVSQCLRVAPAQQRGVGLATHGLAFQGVGSIIVYIEEIYNSKITIYF